MRKEEEVKKVIQFLEEKVEEWDKSGWVFMEIVIDGFEVYNERYEAFDAGAWIKALKWVLGEAGKERCDEKYYDEVSEDGRFCVKW